MSEWRRWPWLSWSFIAATLIGCQALVTSGLIRPRMVVMLPAGRGDAVSNEDFLRGFRVGQASVEACGDVFPEVAWQGLAPGDSSKLQLMSSQETTVVVAPPAADLRAFAELAADQDLTVLLPFQRGQSLDTLRGLEGRERLWPLVPSQKDDLKATATAAIQAGWGRAMVVTHPEALEASASDAFVSLFQAAGGTVESYEQESVQRVDPADGNRLELLKKDIAYSSVPTVVVADAPDGSLARRLRQDQEQGRFGGGAPQSPNWIWLTPADDLEQVPSAPWQQLGLQHPARGENWMSFNSAFQSRWGQTPSLLAAAGFDTARLLAVVRSAPLPLSAQGSRDAMGWLNPDLDAVPICDGLARRRRGESLRLEAAASDARFLPGQAPSGEALAGVLIQ